MNAHELFTQLLFAEDEDTADDFLIAEGLSLDNEDAWQPLGDIANNFSTVGNQQTEATGALVEKIINGIDSVLMAECARGGIEPSGTTAPKSMSQAVEAFFGVKGGRLENLSPTQQGVLADNIHLVAVGARPIRGSKVPTERPSYLIIDRGGRLFGLTIHHIEEMAMKRRLYAIQYRGRDAVPAFVRGSSIKSALAWARSNATTAGGCCLAAVPDDEMYGNLSVEGESGIKHWWRGATT